MSLRRERKIVAWRNQLKEPLKFNPFLFSRLFFLWVFIGLIGGLIAGVYWIFLEHLMHALTVFDGFSVIPLMALAGLLARSGYLFYRRSRRNPIDCQQYQVQGGEAGTQKQS